NNFYDIEKSAKLKYDMFLTDFQRPNISGFEVLGELGSGAYTYYNGQPIVAMTGRKDLERAAYLQAGFANIVHKPFAKDRFIEMLGELFPTKVTRTQKIEPEEKIASGSNLFSLKVISSFLGDDRD